MLKVVWQHWQMTNSVCLPVNRQGEVLTFNNDVSPISSISSIRSTPLLPGLTVEGTGSFPSSSSYKLHIAVVHKVASLNNKTEAPNKKWFRLPTIPLIILVTPSIISFKMILLASFLLSLVGAKYWILDKAESLTFTFMHLADTFIQSDFQKRDLQMYIGHWS